MWLRKVERFVKDWTLLIAIVLGGIFHEFFGYIDSKCEYLLPALIFLMLFMSFSKLEGFSSKGWYWHLIAMAIQLVVGVGLYFAVRTYDEVLAVGISICVIVSPATASAVVVGLMNGNIAFSTAFLLIDSIMAAIALPLWLAFIGAGGSAEEFLPQSLAIAEHTLVVVLIPLAIAMIVRKAYPKLRENLLRYTFINYYLWAFALMIIMGRSIDVFLSQEPEPDYKFAFESLVLSFLVCFCLIMGGKLLGGDKATGISIGQGLGQKNTVLAIWLASTFLHPLAMIVPTMYVISQNVINSVQLWYVNRSSLRDERRN